MTSQLTKEQQKRFDSFWAEYDAIKAETDKQLDKLIASRGGAAVMPPLPKRQTKKAMEAWSAACEKAQNEWYESGSPEWKAEYERLTEEQDRLDRKYMFDSANYVTAAEEANFKAIADDRSAVLQDAQEVVDNQAEGMVAFLLDMVNHGGKANGLISTKDGYELDEDVLRNQIERTIRRHRTVLNETTEGETLDAYIEAAIRKAATTPLVKAEYTGELIEYSPQYVRPLVKFTDLIFDNRVTLKEGEKELYPVALDKDKKVVVGVALDYNKFLQDGTIAAIPKLDGDARDFHDALCALWDKRDKRRPYLVLPFTVIYKQMSGKVDKDVTLTPAIAKLIHEKAEDCRGILKIKGFEYTDENGRKHRRGINEPIVSFKEATDEMVNGQKVEGKKFNKDGELIDGAIVLMGEPPLYTISKLNHYEIATRDVKALDVPGMNNTPENRAIRRVIIAKIDYAGGIFKRQRGKKKEVDIRNRRMDLAEIYKEIGIENPSAKRRGEIKDKATAMLDYWKERGDIADYKFVKYQSRSYNRLELFFMKDE